MADIVGEGKIVLSADTALLIAQIEKLNLPPIKVKVEIAKRDQIISPEFKLSAASKRSLQSEINKAIAEASRGAGRFTLTNTEFTIGSKTKNTLRANLAKTIREVSAQLMVQPINVSASINRTELDASAEKAALGARERMQLVFGKPLKAFVNADISGALGAFNRFDVASRATFKRIGLAWGVTTAGIVAGTAAIGIAAVTTFADLEKSATNAASIVAGSDLTGGKTLAQSKVLFDQAKKQFIEGAQQIAKTTVFSAKQAADGYYFLASAGLSARDSLALLPQISKFAQAGQFDLQQSTEGLLQSFNALGLNIGTFGDKQKAITKLTDELSNANIKSITDLQNLSDALKNQAAASFTQYGQSIETTIATLEQFSKVGVTGLKAGQQAAITIRELFNKGTSDKFSPVFKQFGINLKDANGKARQFGDIIADVARATNRLGGPGSIASIKLFKTLGLSDRSTNGLRNLVAAERNGTLKNAAKDLEKSAGLTGELAGLQQTSLSAVFQNFKDAINSLLVTAGAAPAAVLTKFFNSFNVGNKLSREATGAFKVLGDELASVTKSVLSFVSGGGLVKIIKGVNDLAVGTFKGLAGFGDQFAKAFGGKGASGAQGFADLLTRIGELSAKVFPQVGAALGRLSKFFVDNETQILALTKAWLELTAAIFALRVIVVPLQKVASVALVAARALGGRGLSGSLIELVATSGRVTGPIGAIAAVFVLALKDSQNLRRELAAGFKIPFKFLSDIGKLGGAILHLIPGVHGASTVFRLLGNVIALSINKALAPLRLLDGIIVTLTDLLNGNFSSAWNHAKNAALDFGNSITFGVFPRIANALDNSKANLQGYADALNNVAAAGDRVRNGIIATLNNGPKERPLQGPGLGGRESGLVKSIQDARVAAAAAANNHIAALDITSTADAAKLEKKREALLKSEGRAIQQQQDKIRSTLKTTQAQIKSNDLKKSTAIKDYLDAVKRAADNAKQAVADFGNQITQSLIKSLDPLKAQGNINQSLDDLFKTLRTNMGVLAGSDTERARANLDALSGALSSIGDAAKGINDTQGPGAVKGFLNAQVGTLLTRAQAAFTSGQISADQLKQLQDQANKSLADAGSVKIPVALKAVDENGKPVEDPRKNGITKKFDMLNQELVAKSKNLSRQLGIAATPNGKSLIVGFTDGVKAQWTNQAKPYLQDLGKKIPNGLGGQLILRKRMTPHGEAIMLGLQDGMKTVWQRDVTTFIKNVAPWIALNKGPITTDAALLVPHGNAIMGGLLAGLKSGWAVVMNFIHGVTQSVKDSAAAIGSSFSGAFSGLLGGGSGGGGQFQGKFANLINAAAKKNKIDPLLLASIIKQESGFNPNAKSGAGAEGLGQLIPSTAAGLGVTNPFDPAQNIGGSAKYIAQLLKEFGGNTKLAVAAYNAGPNAVQKAGGVPHFSETQKYVENVLANLATYQQQSGKSDTFAGGFPFPLLKTAFLAATMNLDGANRLSLGPVGAAAQESGLHVTAGKFHHSKFTSEGKLSDHGSGNALDVSGSKKAMIGFAELARKFFRPSQLIHSPLGESFNGGPWQAIGDAQLRAEHFSHVHVGRPHLFSALEEILSKKVKGSRASGGAHESGTYLVGERGPELRSFGSRGEIITNANLTGMLNQMKSGSQQGGSAIGQLHVHTNAQNPEVIAAVVESKLRGRSVRI